LTPKRTGEPGLNPKRATNLEMQKELAKALMDPQLRCKTQDQQAIIYRVIRLEKVQTTVSRREKRHL